ncbi:DDB1- and CUL4-associated factor 10-like, partial [Limulus polyphemus]|uniref:DDB1- and CUL4-associated factor 10-like n=1 Tax=Limulus polyphemus TaxID=6850 RepID=A0ABM1C0N2_LIMPO
SLLVAATELRSILLFDPLNHQLISTVQNAHSHCVNYARFLDSRVFATCSDDKTVALWDTRFLKHKIISLKGHSSWVKNIEYARDTGLLVTSGFDGNVYTWNINGYSEGDVTFRKVFHTKGLMRMRLTPDSSKMIISTNTGYLMVIHDLDLTRLATDLKGFKPNMYRLMQMGNTPLSDTIAFNHLFRAKRNRVELISDFPEANDALFISSLQVHPNGWCVLSRNMSSYEHSEWTCVHDIQEHSMSDKSEKDENSEAVEEEENEIIPDDEAEEEESGDSSRTASQESGGENLEDSGSSGLWERPVVHIRLNYGPQSQESQEESASTNTQRFRFGDIELRILRHRRTEPSLSFTPTITVSPSASSAEQPSTSSGEDFTVPSEAQRLAYVVANSVGPDQSPSREQPLFFLRTGSEQAARKVVLVDGNRTSQNRLRKSSKIHQNYPRLTHYSKEPNVGRGFIKELCFSTDGRLICSPYGFGVRLFTFNKNCSELCDCVPETPAQLHELCTNLCHVHYVVSTKFSPTHCQLVSGCLDGKVCFHQPIL